MFTGIIKTIGKVEKAITKNGSLFLTIKRPRGWQVALGDSIATDGVCLTVTNVTRSNYTTELMPETLALTTFGVATPAVVNLEPALRLNDLVGGHLVSGHIDTVGTITKIQPVGNARVVTISFPAQFASLIVAKGSVTVDGISLTVVKTGKTFFTVSLIAYTLAHTTIGTKKVNDEVNIEFDIVAKYLAQLSTSYAKNN